ncbi:MAG: magnesium/cobalt efflux protein, partial [Alphaproteobacteria bacterium]
MLNKIKSLFEKHPEEEEAIETLEEIMDKREERGDEVLVADDEVLLMKNLFHLRDIRAADVLIPRSEISAISLTAKLSDLKKIILADKFTRIPVYEKT